MQARGKAKGEIIVEDGSGEINCLNGFPGPLIKWFWKSLGNKGLADLVDKFNDKSIVAKSVIEYSIPRVKLSFSKV